MQHKSRGRTYYICTQRTEGVSSAHVEMRRIEPLQEADVIKTLSLLGEEGGAGGGGEMIRWGYKYKTKEGKVKCPPCCLSPWVDIAVFARRRPPTQSDGTKRTIKQEVTWHWRSLVWMMNDFLFLALSSEFWISRVEWLSCILGAQFEIILATSIMRSKTAIQSPYASVAVIFSTYITSLFGDSTNTRTHPETSIRELHFLHILYESRTAKWTEFFFLFF